MSTAIAEILGQYPRTQETPGRLVLGLTGDIQSMVSGHKSEDHIIKERALILRMIRERGLITKNQLADETGIDVEHVVTRLTWLQRRGIVECWKRKGQGYWRVAEDYGDDE